MNENKKLAIDFREISNEGNVVHTPETNTSSSKIVMESYNESISVFEFTLAKLNKKELLEFVEYCVSFENSDSKNQNCWMFVSLSIEHLHSNGKVFPKKIEDFRNQLKKIRNTNKKKYIKKFKKNYFKVNVVKT